jgi:hypothetical protein
MRILPAAFALLLFGCGADALDPAAGDAGIDATVPLMLSFTVQQPTTPRVQQLINSCASGVQTDCLALCRSLFCEFGDPGPSLQVLACTLERSGPLANITATYVGDAFCMEPGLPDFTP